MGRIKEMAAECAVLLGLLICASPIEAQTVQQSGSVTQNHIATWATNGVIKDGGAVVANQSLMGGSSTTTAASTTVYCASAGCGASVATASQVPFTGTLSNLNASVVTAPGSGHSVVATVYTGAYGSAAASTLTCTIANTATSCTDTAHQVNLPLGTTWTIQFAVGASATSTGGQAGSVQFTSTGPPTPTTPYVLQSGVITSGHQAVWTTNGVIQDGGVPVTSAIAPGPFVSGDIVYVNTLLQLASSGVQLSSVAPLLSPAFTGTPTAPTAAPGTNTTQLATTAFVQAAATPCTVLGSFSVGTGAGTQCSTVAGSQAILNGGPLTINPTVNTLNQGLNVFQTAPAGTPAGPIALNLISMTDLGVNPSGAGTDGFGYLNAQINGVRVNYIAQGAGIHIGMAAASAAPADVGNLVGFTSSVYTNSTLGATQTGQLWGGIAFAEAGASATVPWLIAHEAEILAAPGSTITRRVAYSANSQGQVQGSLVDAAYIVSLIGTSGFGTPSPFKDLMLVSSNFYGAAAQPIDPAGNFFRSDATITVANFANLPNVTFSGNIINTPSLVLAGNGTAVFGAGSGSLPTLGIEVTCTSCGNTLIQGSTNVTTGFAGLTTGSSTGNNFLFVRTNENNYSTSILGQTGGAWSEVVSNGSSSNGLLIGSLTAKPVIFGANNAEIFRLTSIGGINLTSTTPLEWNTTDVILGDGGVGFLRQGGGDVASPVAQGMSVTSVVAGTSNTGGSDYTWKGAASTGNATGGGFQWQTTLAGGSGTSQNSFTTQMRLTGAGFLGLGNVNPKTFLDVNGNTVTSPALINAATGVRFLAPNAADGAVEVVSYGQPNGNAFISGIAAGTAASPTATAQFHNMFNLAGFGYNSGFVQGGAIVMSTSEAWSGGHQGTRVSLFGTPNASTTLTEYLQIGGDTTISLFNMATGAGNGAICGSTNVVNSTGGVITYQNAAACTTSLRQFKRNIEPLDAGLDEVMQLRPRQFYFLAGHGNNGTRQQMGLVADEVEKVDPRLATYDSAGNLSGVDYVYSVTLAFKAIQELKADNDNLRVELTQLKKAVNR